jgi:hypothetical protein
MLSVTFLAAPADDVATTATIEVPIARRMSRWKTRVSTGTITNPPPRPNNEPRAPARTETPNSTDDNSTMVTMHILSELYVQSDNSDSPVPQTGQHRRNHLAIPSSRKIPGARKVTA